MLQYFDVEMITLRGTNSHAVDVPALTYGPFAICHAIGGELAVCHIPSGQRIRNVATLADGARVVALLNGLNVDWQGIDPEWKSDSIATDYPHLASIYRQAMGAIKV